MSKSIQWGMIFLVFLLGDNTLLSQVGGLWEVEKVSVGSEQMTPVAKWFDLRDNQRLYSGNGGVRNTLGKWDFDEEQQKLLFYNEQGQPDEMGPFLVKVDSEKMQWKRVEEGQNVLVELRRTLEKPLAPWDEIVGFWKVLEPEKLPGAPKEIFIRWDRMYIFIFEDSRQRGVWHVDGHRPLLRLLSDEGDDFDQTWHIEFPEPDQLIWRNEKENIYVELIRRK